MFWVRYTVFALLMVFVGTSIAANVLPLYHFKSSSPTSTLDASVNLYVHTSTFYLWYQEVQLARDSDANTVEVPETGGAITLPGKTKVVLRLLSSEMRDIPSQAASVASFSHVSASCASIGRELLAAAAMAVLGTAFGGLALIMVAWGRGPANSCLVPGWIAFVLTFCAALFTLIALALTAHMRNNPICYRFALSKQGYHFESGFILLCVSFAGYAITAATQAMCPMCCCCYGGGAGTRGYGGALEDSDSDQYPSTEWNGDEAETGATSAATTNNHSRVFRESESNGKRARRES